MPGSMAWMAVFDSIHYALAAERAFQERGLWCDLSPAPHEIDSTCAMVLEFHPEDREAAREVLTQPALRMRGVFAPAAAGYEKVEW
jgi:hypothetical protein